MLPRFMQESRIQPNFNGYHYQLIKTMDLFTTYQVWRTTMEKRAGLTLDTDYCNERIAVLEDEDSTETKLFIKSYGADYHRQVISWFQQALSET